MADAGQVVKHADSIEFMTYGSWGNMDWHF